ncbi:hypothetical protein PRI8871_03659 [Pseudoprimorskyibacter insulae]|uniref:Histidine kinase/HSP90-like ATPase domain-containing protein n=2 Tax=Pseudoprimorskyibacter insulae TaxID=1695997 RepID=A0A2R8B0Z7_9RHOB|nr:hypothetical protein PRI8871_03659 [Pseudoprimorskyibacter insulae]
MEAVDNMVVSLARDAMLQLDAGTAMRFELANAEVLTNIVKHALRGGDENAVVDIVVTSSERGVVFEAYDPEGVLPFDPRDNQIDLNKVDFNSESGRGIGILLECADEIDYGEVNGRNRLSNCFWNPELQKDTDE